MTVYFLEPAMTIGDNELARRVQDSCCGVLSSHVSLSAVGSNPVALSIVPESHDAIVFFNRQDTAYSSSLTSLFGLIRQVGADVFPVALNPSSRQPPSSLNRRQSFDITDELRRRGLTEDQVETVGVALAHEVIARSQPTLSKGKMNLFVSYRRLDGEEIAASVHSQLVQREQGTFRDLISIRVGEDAEAVIDDRLRASDAVIFLDTPKAGQSEWVARELATALSYNLPIVWVRFGGDHDRTPMMVSPAIERPHLSLPEIEAGKSNTDEGLADRLIKLAFELTRFFAEQALDGLKQLRDLTADTGATLREVSRKKMIYSVSVPRGGFRYRQRPVTHVVQLFGRRPSIEDVNQLRSEVSAGQEEKYPQLVDATVLLAPIPGQIARPAQVISEGDGVEFIDSYDEYIEALSQIMALPKVIKKAQGKGIVISGAFPDCEPLFQQRLADALHVFVKLILDRQGVVIFGGHPTFQHLILDLARLRRPADFRQAVHLYLSGYFVTEDLAGETKTNATVSLVQATVGSREASLTALRQAMIRDELAAGLVVMGGKTAAGGHNPGVDEEILLARANGLPVFVVGSVGGRSAQIASELDRKGWANAPNGLSQEENRDLLLSTDYRRLAAVVLDSIGF